MSLEGSRSSISHSFIPRGLLALTGVIALIAVLSVFTGCSKPARDQLPSWYYEIGYLNGTNMPHVYPDSGYDDLSDALVQHSQFQNNLKGLKMNVFRLPISWNSYSGPDGAVDLANIRKGAKRVRDFVARLESICEKPPGYPKPGGGRNDSSRAVYRVTTRSPASAPIEHTLEELEARLKVRMGLTAGSVQAWNDDQEASDRLRKLEAVDSWLAERVVDRVHPATMNRKVASVGPKRAPKILPVDTPTPSPTPAWQNRCVVVLDFHNYKFGPNCGGDGAPEGILKGETGDRALSALDSNCVFKGWWHVWNNTNGVRTKWIDFSTEFISVLHKEFNLFEGNKWLTFAIEPMNEPFAGSTSKVVALNANDRSLSVLELIRRLDGSLYSLKDYLENEQPKRVGDLVNYYREFLASLDRKGALKSVATNSLFWFQPFLMDFHQFFFKKWSLVILPTRDVLISAKGDYSGMKDLQYHNGLPVYWIAGPHQYYGSSDSGIFGAVPESLTTFLKLDQFPNNFFTLTNTIQRLKDMESHFRSLGMETVIGEWGTGTLVGNIWKANQNIEGYSFSRDTPGWQAWVLLNNLNFRVNMKGAVWWRYVMDRIELSPKQDRYYLLRGVDDQGKVLGYESQLLKCRKSMANNLDLVPAVFWLNSNDDCPKPK